MILEEGVSGADRVEWERREGWEYLFAHRSRRLWTAYHDVYAVSASHDFGQTWRYRGKLHEMQEPGCMIMEPGEAHRTLRLPHDHGVSFQVAMIPVDALEAAAAESGPLGVPHMRIAKTPSPQLTAAVLRLGEAVRKSEPSLGIQSLQCAVVANLLECSERPPRKRIARQTHRATARAKDYLHAHLADGVSLDELALASGLSKFRLSSVFSRDVGMPPHAFHLQLRIARARELLLEGMPSNQVAAMLGFSDQSHFIRHFRRILQVSPGAYSGGPSGRANAS